MRAAVAIGICGLAAVVAWGAPGMAQSDGDDAQDACAQTETWFMSAVEARLEGKSKSRVRRSLRGEMGTTAAEQLVEFVFALPENMLTPEVGKAARAQCEAL